MSNNTPIFTAEDFSFYVSCPANMRREITQQAADIANAKLSRLLGPVVFGYEDPKLHDHTDWATCEVSDDHTHRARLFDVRPIEAKMECKHTYAKIIIDEHVMQCRVAMTEVTGDCAKCGAKLRAKWEVVE